jgi:ribosomal RNA-processing protein 12
MLTFLPCLLQKIILKVLVKHYGYQTLMPFVPESETRLLTHMRKLDERQKRKKHAQRAEIGERRGAAAFEEIVESDEEDSDDGRTFTTGATGFSKMTSRSMKSTTTKSVGNKTNASSKASKKSLATSASASSKRVTSAVQLPDETDGEVVDMLGAKMAKRVHFSSDAHADRSNDDDDSGGEMEFDDDGKLIVPDDDDVRSRRNGKTDLEEESAGERSGKRRKLSKFEEAKMVKKNNESGKKGPRQLGSAYKSKKAGGDVKRKDQKFEPYAYVPLDGRQYSKKFRKNAVEQMSTVVRQGGGKRKRR